MCQESMESPLIYTHRVTFKATEQTTSFSRDLMNMFLSTFKNKNTLALKKESENM